MNVSQLRARSRQSSIHHPQVDAGERQHQVRIEATMRTISPPCLVAEYDKILGRIITRNLRHVNSSMIMSTVYVPGCCGPAWLIYNCRTRLVNRMAGDGAVNSENSMKERAFLTGHAVACLARRRPVRRQSETYGMIQHSERGRSSPEGIPVPGGTGCLRPEDQAGRSGAGTGLREETTPPGPGAAFSAADQSCRM